MAASVDRSSQEHAVDAAPSAAGTAGRAAKRSRASADERDEAEAGPSNTTGFVRQVRNVDNEQAAQDAPASVEPASVVINNTAANSQNPALHTQATAAGPPAAAEVSSPMMWSPAVQPNGQRSGSGAVDQQPDGENIDLGHGLAAEAGATPDAPGFLKSSAEGVDAADAGPAHVVDLQAHESPAPLPASAMHWAKSGNAQAASAQSIVDKGASAAWQGFQQQAAAEMAEGAPAMTPQDNFRPHKPSQATVHKTGPPAAIDAATPQMYGGVLSFFLVVNVILVLHTLFCCYHCQCPSPQCIQAAHPLASNVHMVCRDFHPANCGGTYIDSDTAQPAGTDQAKFNTQCSRSWRRCDPNANLAPCSALQCCVQACWRTHVCEQPRALHCCATYHLVNIESGLQQGQEAQQVQLGRQTRVTHQAIRLLRLQTKISPGHLASLVQEHPSRARQLHPQLLLQPRAPSRWPTHHFWPSSRSKRQRHPLQQRQLLATSQSQSKRCMQQSGHVRWRRNGKRSGLRRRS